MDRSQFAAGKSQEEVVVAKVSKDIDEAVVQAVSKADIAKKDPQPLPNGKAVGEGHGAATHTLVPDSFIDKLNSYMPKK